jgi:hypothetical protein
VRQPEVTYLTVGIDLPEDAVVIPERDRKWTLADVFQYVTNEDIPIMGPITEKEHLEEEKIRKRMKADREKQAKDLAEKLQREEELAKKKEEEAESKEEEEDAPHPKQAQNLMANPMAMEEVWRRKWESLWNIWTPRWEHLEIPLSHQVPITVHIVVEFYWKEELVLRKGFEWEDFQFLMDSRLKDYEWEAWMAGERWENRFRKPFLKQKITVLAPDEKTSWRRERQRERGRKPGRCSRVSKGLSPGTDG